MEYISSVRYKEYLPFVIYMKCLSFVGYRKYISSVGYMKYLSFMTIDRKFRYLLIYLNLHHSTFSAMTSVKKAFFSTQVTSMTDVEFAILTVLKFILIRLQSFWLLSKWVENSFAFVPRFFFWTFELFWQCGILFYSSMKWMVLIVSTLYFALIGITSKWSMNLRLFHDNLYVSRCEIKRLNSYLFVKTVPWIY